MSIPTGLEQVLAEHQIRNLCYRYARGSDRRDPGVFESVFWEDGTFNGMGNGAPIGAVAQQIAGVMSKYFALTHHLNGNILIEFKDANQATSEVYFRAFHLTRPELDREALSFLIGERRLAELSHADGASYDIVVGGRYLDQLQRRGEEWRISDRRLVFDYTTVTNSTNLRVGEGMSAMSAASDGV